MCNAILLGLKVTINDLAILVDRSPEALALTVDLHEYSVNVERIAEVQFFSLQSKAINGSEI
jgi:hypothetical protein